MRPYAKMLAQVAATVLAALIPLLTLGAITPVGWVNLAIVAVGAAAVFTGPNVPGANYTKTVLSVLAAVLVLLVDFILGGLTVAEWLQLAMAALGALGVYAIPNAGPGVLTSGRRDTW